MTPSQHSECSLEQADNRFDLENGNNAGDSEDLFGAPDHTQFSDSTSPDSKWWDGSNSGLNITQISASGPTMTFVTPGISGWIHNRRVFKTYSHANTKYAFAVIEGISGWKQIRPASADGVSNVLDILKVAQANAHRVSVYIGSDGQIYSTFLVT